MVTEHSTTGRSLFGRFAMRLTRWLRHRWTDESDLRRAT